MTRKAREQLTGIAITLVTLALGSAALSALSGGQIVPIAAVLAIAFAKGRIIILDFMELRESSGGLRTALLAWPVLLLLLAFARSVAVALFG
jgi:hypothetical protein